MYCNQCGKKITDDALFCPECGAKQECENEELTIPMKEVKKLKKKGKKIFILVLLIPMIFLVLTIAFYWKESTNSKFATESEAIVLYDYGKNAFFNLNGEQHEVEVPFYIDKQSSADGCITAYLEGDREDLYCIDARMQPSRVASAVATYVVSHNGKYIAFIQDIDEKQAGSLYIYSVEEKKNTKIDTNVYGEHLCISPDGKAVAYLKNYEDENDNELYIGGLEIQSQEIDNDGCKPVAVRVEGKGLYYINNNKLYAYNEKNTEKIASNVSDFVGFNEDVSEVLYVSEGKTYFYTSKSDEAVKVSGKAMSYVSAPIKSICSYNEHGCIWGTKSLKGCVLISEEDDLYWFNQKGTEMIKIASTNYNFQVAENGKSLIYLMSGKLHKIELLSDEMEEEILFDGEADRIIASDDLSKIYLCDGEDLYYLKKNGELEKITNDFCNDAFCSYLAYNTEMDKLFFVEKDSLMYVGTIAKSKTKVATDINSVYPCAQGVIFYQYEDENETIPYYVKNKESIKLFK